MSRSPIFAAVDAEQATPSGCDSVPCTSITPPIQDEKIVDAPIPTLEEGGRAGWLTVFGAFWALFATFGQVNSFGSYQAYYVKHQLSAYTSSDVSWIGSVQLWVFFFSGAFVGRLFDAYGPKPLITAGTFIITLSLMLTSLCTEYYQFILAQGILAGAGIGLVFYPAVSSTQTHFVRLRATASSLAVTGSSLGGIVFPFLLQKMFSSIGFGWAVRASAFVCLVCCLVSLLCCTSCSPPRKAGPLFDLSAFADPRFMVFSLGSGIACLGLYVPYFYVTQYAEDILHVSSGQAISVLSVMNAGSFVGRPIPGLLADLFGRFNLIIPSTLIAGVLMLAIWFTSHSFASLMCFAAFYGMFSGSFIALNPPCIAQISRQEQIGTRVGLVYAMLSFPSLLGTPIAGAIMSHSHGSYSDLIIFAGATMMVGAGILTFVKLQLNKELLAKV